MRITIKGQVTIPQAIRERHGLLPGTEVRFVEEAGVVRIERADQPPSRGKSIVDAMRAAARRRGPPERLTTDEIMALTRAPEEEGAAEARGGDHRRGERGAGDESAP
jgi:AbrB family looped-hinge helix DNA binding protein